MIQLGLAFMAALFTWWMSTGAIIFLCSLPAKTFRWSMFGATLALAPALYWLVRSSQNLGMASDYIAFVSALAVWAWIELSFLTGFVTGPRSLPCPADAKGLRRFGLAALTLLYHETAIVFAASAIVLLTWNAPNQTGTITFLILTAMRISAKLNIFLGVPNLTDEFLPARLSYLKSYFRKRDFNHLFPISIAGSTLVAIALAQLAITSTPQTRSGYALSFALIALAILEHLFMIMPIPDAALWRWALPSKSVDKFLP